MIPSMKKLLKVIVIIGFGVALLLGVAEGDTPDDEKTSNLSPTNSNDQKSFVLEPQQTGRYNVNLQPQGVVNGVTYVLNQNNVAASVPTTGPLDPDLIWVWKYTGGDAVFSFVFEVANTVWENRQDTVTVTCQWDPETGTGSGTGPGQTAQSISGQADGMVSHKPGSLSITDLAILDPPDYLCINETLELSAWVMRPNDFPWDFLDSVEAEWEVTPTEKGIIDPLDVAHSVIFTPLETGDVTITATAPGTEGPITDSVTITIIKVDFNKDPVKVGIGATRTSETAAYPATTPATYPHRLIATITPKDTAGAVTFDSSSVARMTVAEVSRTDVGNTKQVILNVTGVAKTPVASPGGDADVRALLNGNPCKTAKAIVLIPTAIHSPHPEFDGTVVGQNLVLDSTTSPGAIVGAGNVALASGVYITFQTITVDDQFGDTLHAVYGGSPVSEYGGIAINQAMTSSGTYSDPVGNGAGVSVVPAENPPGTPNPAIAAFLVSPVPTAPNATAVQNVPVEVDGHSLNPAVVNRRVTTSVPNNLKIEWP